MPRQPRPAIERFQSKVEPRGAECWLWQGALFKTTGYGAFNLRGSMTTAHRASYELHVGPIPEGMHLDHLCRVRACVNPAHLEPVTLAENNRRAGAAVTVCRHGHDYTEANTYVDPNGRRRCRECNRDACRRRALVAVASVCIAELPNRLRREPVPTAVGSSRQRQRFAVEHTTTRQEISALVRA